MCYTVPLVATLILNGVKGFKKIQIPHSEKLNLLLIGGSVMLVVDHWWNGELFLVGENIIKDLLLGVAMTGAVFIFWGIAVVFKKMKVDKNGLGFPLARE